MKNTGVTITLTGALFLWGCTVTGLVWLTGLKYNRIVQATFAVVAKADGSCPAAFPFTEYNNDGSLHWCEKTKRKTATPSTVIAASRYPNADEIFIGGESKLTMRPDAPKRSIFTYYSSPHNKPSTIWGVEIASGNAPMCALEMGPHVKANLSALLEYDPGDLGADDSIYSSRPGIGHTVDQSDGGNTCSNIAAGHDAHVECIAK